MINKRLLLSLILLVGVGLCEDVERKDVVRENPEYPQVAREMNLHGTVKLKVWIAPTGKVSRVEYIGGHPLLAESAIAAIKKWKFEAGPKETTQVMAFKF